MVKPVSERLFILSSYLWRSPKDGQKYRHVDLANGGFLGGGDTSCASQVLILFSARQISH